MFVTIALQAYPSYIFKIPSEINYLLLTCYYLLLGTYDMI